MIGCFSSALQESGRRRRRSVFRFQSARQCHRRLPSKQRVAARTGPAMGVLGLRLTETEIVQLRAPERERRGVNAPELESASTPASQIRSCPDFFAIICRPGLPSLDGQVSINRNCNFKTLLIFVKPAALGGAQRKY